MLVVGRHRRLCCDVDCNHASYQACAAWVAAKDSVLEREGTSTSHLTPHTSHLTPHTSHLTPHTSHLTPHTSHLTPHTSHAKGERMLAAYSSALRHTEAAEATLAAKEADKNEYDDERCFALTSTERSICRCFSVGMTGSCLRPGPWFCSR
jgi:hypothetical protein